MRIIAWSSYVCSSDLLKADLVLLAMGFLGPRKAGMIEQSGVGLDPRGNDAANVVDYKSSVSGVFSCGDMRRGQALGVWAIREGRQCAHPVEHGSAPCRASGGQSVWSSWVAVSLKENAQMLQSTQGVQDS